MKLEDLEFTDLYVCMDPAIPSHYAPRPVPNARTPLTAVVPPEFRRPIEHLRSLLAQNHNKEFSLEVEGMRLRASRQRMMDGEVWVAMRRVPLKLPELAELGFQPGTLEAMKGWGHRLGLIVIGGATRSGKTTTAVSLMVHYMRTHGGIGYTVEDPVEYFIQGRIGEEGRCFQIEITDDSQWEDAIKTSLRWAPKYILVGELRTPQAARQLLRLATSGHTVICTVHGGSVEETLTSIIHIAEHEVGQQASSLLADGLIGVVHQQVSRGRIVMNMVQTSGKSGDPVRSAIRSGKMNTLGTYIEQQAILRGDRFEHGENGGTLMPHNGPIKKTKGGLFS